MHKPASRFLVLMIALANFTLSTSAPALSQEQVLYSFQEDDNGAYPQSSVVLDAQGNIFGTANLAGADGAGTIFEMSPSVGGGYTYTLLYTFTGGDDGANPHSGLLLDKSGNLFGTAVSGGGGSLGTAFELTPAGGAWTYKVIHHFTGGADGGFPSGDLISDGKGNLYGATSSGGDSQLCSLGCGTIFRLKRSPEGKWKEKILYRFQGGTDGSGPLGALVMDKAGNLYGATFQGGSPQCPAGCGVVFKLTPTTHGPWQKQTLAAFADKKHGWASYGGLALDHAGNLFGTTSLGGNTTGCNPPNGCGTLFKVTAQGKQTVMHKFGQTSADGVFPMAGLIRDASGHLFGTAPNGGKMGNGCGGGCGVVFDFVTTSGKLEIIHKFNGADGAMPEAPLFWDGAGHLFSTTFEGGTGFAGTVFELTP